MKNKWIALLVCVVLGCGDPMEFEDSELGQIKQPVGIKIGSNFFSYGVTVASTHIQIRGGNTPGSTTLLSVPETKAPTFFLASSLTTQEKTDARNAFAYVDGKTNWTFTETTDSATATLTVNRLDDACLDGQDIQKLVCTNLSGNGGTLSEPVSIPNVYTTHTKGTIHVDRASINASTANATERNLRRYHGLIVAAISWMGHGMKPGSLPSPTRSAILLPSDIITDFTAGEICAMNGFLPKAQLGSATSIQIVSACASD